ncbi:hypothetical protein NL676_006798 [Syzygium grande]|nr:hypothetical protein NL676_006798 [Syzygium grande]
MYEEASIATNDPCSRFSSSRGRATEAGLENRNFVMTTEGEDDGVALEGYNDGGPQGAVLIFKNDASFCGRIKKDVGVGEPLAHPKPHAEVGHAGGGPRGAKFPVCPSVPGPRPSLPSLFPPLSASSAGLSLSTFEHLMMRTCGGTGFDSSFFSASGCIVVRSNSFLLKSFVVLHLL